MPLHDSRARAERAFQLRAVGWSWNRIAAELGYASHGAAQTAVRRHEARTSGESSESSRRSLIESARVTTAVLFDRFAAAAEREDDKTMALLNGEIARNRDQLAKLTGAYMPVDVKVTSADEVKRLRDEFYQLRGGAAHYGGKPTTVPGKTFIGTPVVDASADSNKGAGRLVRQTP